VGPYGRTQRQVPLPGPHRPTLPCWPRGLQTRFAEPLRRGL